MKFKTPSTFIISLFLTGCTIPCDIYFRNFSNDTVRLHGKLVDRRYFDKLPNKVNFYDTAQKRKQMYGQWKGQQLISWADSNNFYIDIPSNTIIDVANVSNGLVLGAVSPDVLLTAKSEKKTDTITTGDYLSLAAKFKVKRVFLSRPVYYYDFE